MKFQPDVQRLYEAGDWLGLLSYYAEALNLPAVGLDSRIPYIVAMVVCLLLALRVLTRLVKRERIPWVLGKVTIDLMGGKDTIHGIAGGSSGNGKSSALLPLLRLSIPTMACGFDDSAPLQEWWEAHAHDERYIQWKMDGSLGWNILVGPPLAVAEALTAGFARSGQDTGYFRGLARNRLIELIEDDDTNGRPRNLWRYVDLLRAGGGIDAEQNRACRRWAGSFETLLKTLGPALGTDFDLTSAMAQGKKVLLLPNRFMLAESAALIGGIGLVQARRAAAETGNFLVFIEEAGQARNYEEEIDALFQAGRTRGCPTILLTQNISALRKQVTNNVKAWVVFGNEDKDEWRAAASHLWNEPDDFKGLPAGTCWVRAPGIGPVRVKLPLVKPPQPQRNLPVRQSPKKVPSTSSPYEYRRLAAPIVTPMLPARTEVIEIPTWVGKYEERQRIWERLTWSEEPGLLWTPERGFWVDGRCLLWPANGATRGTKKDPRPAAKIDGKTETVYRMTYVWNGGVIPPSYEVDHLCGIPMCCNPEHGEAVTSQENIRRREGRKRALASLAG